MKNKRTQHPRSIEAKRKQTDAARNALAGSTGKGFLNDMIEVFFLNGMKHGIWNNISDAARDLYDQACVASGSGKYEKQGKQGKKIAGVQGLAQIDEKSRGYSRALFNQISRLKKEHKLKFPGEG